MFNPFDPFPKKSKKQVKRETLANNRARGKAAEEQVRSEYEMMGYNMKKTHTGRDYIATRENIFTGKVERKHVEVKSGNAHLSERQQQAKKNNKKGNYVVERRDPWFW